MISTVIGMPWRPGDERGTVNRREVRDPVPRAPIPCEGARGQMERLTHQDNEARGVPSVARGAEAKLVTPRSADVPNAVR